MKNKELRYFKLFRDVCKVINSSLDLKEVLILITENIVKIINAKACTIFLLDGPTPTRTPIGMAKLQQNLLHCEDQSIIK